MSRVMQSPTEAAIVAVCLRIVVSIPFAGHAEAPSTAHETGNIATHADLPPETADHAMSHPSPEWAEKLKGQTIVEDAMEGHPERTSMVERQHQRVMEQMAKDADVQRTSGFFNNMNMMHQYGAGGQDYLLMSQTGTEPISTRVGDVRPARRSGSTTCRRLTWRSRSIGGSTSIPAICTC